MRYENIARNKKQIVQSKKQIIRKQHKTHGGIEISFDYVLMGESNKKRHGTARRKAIIKHSKVDN